MICDIAYTGGVSGIALACTFVCKSDGPQSPREDSRLGQKANFDGSTHKLRRLGLQLWRQVPTQVESAVLVALQRVQCVECRNINSFVHDLIPK